MGVGWPETPGEWLTLAKQTVEDMGAVWGALAGVGGLIFDPKNFKAASTQTRAGFLYGAGADFNVTDHLFIRAEYRGLVYNSPTYDLATLSALDRVTHRAEPTVGFGWRF